MSHATVQQLLAGAPAQLQAVLNTAAASAGTQPAEYRRQLALQLAKTLYLPAGLHSLMAGLWQPLVPDLALDIARSDAVFFKTSGWQRLLAQWLHQQACLWHPADDKTYRECWQAAEHLRDQVLDVLQGADEAALLAALAAQAKAAHKQRQRAVLLSRRICETEISQLRVLTAASRVVETIDQHLAHRPFPVALQQPLRTTLASELRHLVLNQADYQQAPLWQLWQQLLPVLGRCFSGAGMAVADQQLYHSIPPLLDALEQSLAIETIDPLAYEQWVEQLSEHLMAAVKKEEIACELFSPMADADNTEGARMRVTPAVVSELAAYRVGDWFVFFGEREQVWHCELALHEQALDQLLFVDLNGRKLFTKSKKDFAACLSTGIAKRLPLADPIALLQQQLAPCVELALAHRASAQARQASERAREVAAEAQERAQAKAVARQQLQARQDAAHKALAEARALNEAKVQQAQQRAAARAEAQAEADAELRANAAAQVEALQVGAWLQFIHETSRAAQRCKLSVIIASIGKYIFVDELGRKFAEYDREALITLLLSAQASVVRNGDNFDDQLAKVIRGLRKSGT